MKKFFSAFLSFTLIIIISIMLYLPEAAAEEAATAKERPTIPVYTPANAIVAKVNDFEITKKNLDMTTRKLTPTMSYHKSSSERRSKRIEDAAMSKLIIDQLLYEDALNRSIIATPREVKIAIRKFQNNLPKGKTLSKVLKQSNLTRDDLKEIFMRLTLLRKLKKETDMEINKQVEELVNEEFMKEYYNNNLEKFTIPPKISMSEILLSAEPTSGVESWLKVREEAVKVAERIRGGEDFAEVAKEVSQDPYAAKGGDMGWVHSGTLDGGLWEATLGLKVGEISDPLETIYGYHIIKIDQRIPSIIVTFEELDHPNLKEELTKTNHKRLYNEWLESLKEKAEIVYFNTENAQ